jgi:uncharacterized protein (TIGR02118 family)
MLKIVALIEKREDLTWDEFVKYWDEEHVKQIDKVSTLQRYTIAPAIDPDGALYDGIAELYFESTEDIQAGFTEELNEAIQADEEEFLASSETFVAAEQTQIDRT